MILSPKQKLRVSHLKTTPVRALEIIRERYGEEGYAMDVCTMKHALKVYS